MQNLAYIILFPLQELCQYHCPCACLNSFNSLNSSLNMPSGTKLKILRTGVGFIYPVYRSYQAIVSEDMEDDMTWLKYWVILVMVSMMELKVDPLVDLFPGYLVAKCAFLVWCMAPLENNGVSFIFTQVTC